MIDNTAGLEYLGRIEILAKSFSIGFYLSVRNIKQDSSKYIFNRSSVKKYYKYLIYEPYGRTCKKMPISYLEQVIKILPNLFNPLFTSENKSRKNHSSC